MIKERYHSDAAEALCWGLYAMHTLGIGMHGIKSGSLEARFGVVNVKVSRTAEHRAKVRVPSSTLTVGGKEQGAHGAFRAHSTCMYCVHATGPRLSLSHSSRQ